MLVLAMEFSRCAQRPHQADIRQRTDRRTGVIRAGERPLIPQMGMIGVASEGGIASGLPKRVRDRGSLPQNGIVMPTDNSRAHRPHGRDIRRCAVRQGRGGGDSE